jgi:hypothetical protein
MNVAPKKAHDVILRVHGDAVPITVGQRRGDHGLHRWLPEATDATHRLLDLFCFEFQLVRVADVLVTAAAAAPEVWALGFGTFRRRFEHLDQFAFSKLLLLAHNPGRDPFAIDGKRNEDSFTFIARDAFAAESNIFDH